MRALARARLCRVSTLAVAALAAALIAPGVAYGWTKADHKSGTTTWLRSVAAHPTTDMNRAGQGAYDTDVKYPSGRYYSAWHFNENATGVTTLPADASPARIRAKWKTLGFRVVAGDSRVAKYQEQFNVAVLCYKDGMKREAYYQLGLGLHALQDIYAHGDMASSKMAGGVSQHGLYAKTRVAAGSSHYLNPDRLSLKTERWAGARAITKKYAKEFLKAVGVEIK